MKNELIARPLLDSEFYLWDNFVAQSPQGTVFHNSEWIVTTAKELNYRYELIGIFEDDELVGGCPFYMSKYMHILPSGFSTASLSPASGVLLPLRKSSKVRKNFVRENEIMGRLEKYIDNKHLISFKITNYPELDDVRAFTWNGWSSHVNYRYVQKLPFILAHSSEGVKREVKKADKLGIQIKRICNIDEFYPVFWDMTVDTYQKQNLTPPIQKDYLYQLITCAVENGFGDMWLACLPTGEIISGRIVLWDEDVGHFWQGATYEKYLSTGVRSLFNIVLFEEGEQRGVKKMNYMSGNMNSLSQFVTGFNPELEPYFSVSKFKLPLVNTLRKI